MAQRIYNCYWKVCDPQNVLHATYNTVKGKKRRHDVQRLLNGNYIQSVTDVWEMLEKQTYVPSKYHTKIINDGKERRLIIAPLYPDRIVHHCLIDVIENDLRKLFIANTYACIKGRGMHSCLYSLNKALQRDKRGTKYCLKLDIRHYYDSIVHDILKDIIAHKIGDKQMLWLINTIIDSTEGGIGLPIGFLTSQHFANLYLTPFDHWVKEVLRVRYYYRYMDDMVILSDSKDKLHTILDRIREYLQERLQLKIKDNWQIFPVDARSIDFVGYKSNHYNILVRKSILYRYWKKLHKVAKKYGFIDETIIKKELAAHWGWLLHCSEEHKNKIFEISKM
ncbi:RNA-directed DNA polymerase [Dysgonomonas sp. PFB1-18]|uniref:RNA-directed DNA polymerase n=1 Tax=unclassified Dysgonomonas TaxID=2630389 RepID=UPI002475995B|nr:MULTISPECIES: RNA-directed DNA polymerase [unclassified Dysgonomonas]MDH6308134.1 RNA-directed DNA polymerase [Dysgonomonas sp. PF1-14]MDH6339673.1 RNA-directed DNA polymerase [Dysgonomonas sp. PF1-16]MDH6381324.1 RNA-directed DNA polymerase [Dysgonomonas sp. PFB1-18]MDH6398536.1 RNA-directed DNA polymerase [Dysgonomonas sp. PF1-23]